MTEHSPIIPPPELVQQWSDIALAASGMFEVKMQFATLAAQWGSDQELEACCEWMSNRTVVCPSDLRAARRPKPPSLKRVALLRLDTLNADLGLEGKGIDLSQIRRALEQLPND